MKCHVTIEHKPLFIYTFRLITRAVLVPFETDDKEYSLTPAQRREADALMHRAMDKASAAAGVIISLGSSLQESSELEDVMSKVEALLPHCSLQRILTSYSWLLHATLLVSAFEVANLKRVLMG